METGLTELPWRATRIAGETLENDASAGTVRQASRRSTEDQCCARGAGCVHRLPYGRGYIGGHGLRVDLTCSI
jgi:hypothetical protein